MRGHGQLADMYLCLARVPALAKVLRSPTLCSCPLMLLHCSGYAQATGVWTLQRWYYEAWDSAMQVKGRCMSADAFRLAALSCCQFVAVKLQSNLVCGSVLVLDSPFVDESILKGFAQLGTMLQAYGPDW